MEAGVNRQTDRETETHSVTDRQRKGRKGGEGRGEGGRWADQVGANARRTELFLRIRSDLLTSAYPAPHRGTPVV